MLDGKQMMETLSIDKRKGGAGPVFGIIIKEQTEWQLMYPAASAEDCKRHVQARWQEIQKEQAALAAARGSKLQEIQKQLRQKQLKQKQEGQRQKQKHKQEQEQKQGRKQ